MPQTTSIGWSTVQTSSKWYRAPIASGLPPQDQDLHGERAAASAQALVEPDQRDGGGQGAQQQEDAGQLAGQRGRGPHAGDEADGVEQAEHAGGGGACRGRGPVVEHGGLVD